MVKPNFKMVDGFYRGCAQVIDGACRYVVDCSDLRLTVDDALLDADNKCAELLNGSAFTH